MVTMAAAEMPHVVLLFLETCCHIQSCITSVFDVRVLRNLAELGL